MKTRWQGEVDGEQEIELYFNVTYEASGNCYYDPGCTSGPVENCYPPEGECEVTKLTVHITDSEGREIAESSELGYAVMSAFDHEAVLDKLMETTDEGPDCA